MSFNFDDLLNQGKEAADLVEKSNNEIDVVLVELKNALSTFLELEIGFVEEAEYQSDIEPLSVTATVYRMFEPNKKTGYNHLSICHDASGVKRKIMSIKRSNEGYPINVIDGKDNYFAENQEEFAQALGHVVTKSQTHIMLRSFKSEVERTLLEKNK